MPSSQLTKSYFPTSLFGVLVFGCALPPCPPASRLSPAAHNLSTHNLSPRNLSPHNLSTHNLLTHRRGTWRHRPSLCVAGVALHLATSTVTLRGRRGTALGDIDRHFAWQAWLLAWQAWHLATSTYTLRGRRGTHGTGLVLVARLVPS